LLADQASHLKIFAHQVERWFAWSASKDCLLAVQARTACLLSKQARRVKEGCLCRSRQKIVCLVVVGKQAGLPLPRKGKVEQGCVYYTIHPNRKA